MWRRRENDKERPQRQGTQSEGTQGEETPGIHGGALVWDERRRRTFEGACELYDKDREWDALAVVDSLLDMPPGVERGVKRLTEILSYDTVVPRDLEFPGTGQVIRVQSRDTSAQRRLTELLVLDLVKLRSKCFSGLCSQWGASEDVELTGRALENAEICTTVFPDNVPLLTFASQVHATVGLTETALRLAERAVELEDSPAFRSSLNLVRRAVADRRDEARKETLQALELVRQLQGRELGVRVLGSETDSIDTPEDANWLLDRLRVLEAQGAVEMHTWQFSSDAPPDNLLTLARASDLVSAALAITELDIETWGCWALVQILFEDEKGAEHTIQRMETMDVRHPILKEVKRALVAADIPHPPTAAGADRLDARYELLASSARAAEDRHAKDPTPENQQEMLYAQALCSEAAEKALKVWDAIYSRSLNLRPEQ